MTNRRSLIHLGAASIITAHNYPSRGLELSEADLELTKRLAEAGKLIGIELVDHLIIADEDYRSIYERG